MQKFFRGVINAIGIILLSIVVILNIIYTTQIRTCEYAETTKNSIFLILLVAICVFLIYKLITRSKITITQKNNRILVLFIISIAYFILQLVWIKIIDIYPNADQFYTYNFGRAMYNITETELVEADLNYFAYYPFQINLSFVFSIIFKIFHSTNVRIIQVINAFANTLNILAIYLITKELEKKHNVNKKISLIIYLLFTPLILFTTFVYGDFISLTLSLFAIYFIIKYTNTENKRKYLYILLSSICMMISLFVRNNAAIIVMAIAIYLFLDLFKKESKKSNYIYKILSIIVFIIISVMPSRISQNILLTKYDIERGKECSMQSYLIMGIDRSPYGNGWYSARYGKRMVSIPKEERMEIHLKRLNKIIEYYKENPKELLKFYVYKEASMWCEPTFESLYDNLTSYGYQNFDAGYTEYEKDTKLMETERYYVPYMKIVVSFIFVIALLVIITNKKKLTNDDTLFILIFIGGFLFHTIWEAKSRYIIPYVVILIPLCSIKINSIKFNKLKIKKLEKNKNKNGG